MSQIYKNLNGISPPTIPITFQADSGTATAAVNVINVFGGSSEDNNILGIQTTASGNTITYELTNRLYNAVPVPVTGAVTGDIITFDLGASAAVYRFSFDVTGRDTATGDGVGYNVFGSARTDGATATVIASAFVDNDEDATLLAASMNLVASGNDIILQALGVAGQTINFNAVGYYVKV
jgi:hypothetical protein